MNSAGHDQTAQEHRIRLTFSVRISSLWPYFVTMAQYGEEVVPSDAKDSVILKRL